MSVQLMDLNADAVGTVNDTYNISSSNDQLSITIDGGSAQTFTLTHGSTVSAATVVSNLSSLTGATASVVTSNGSNFVRIRDTSALGASSTILINAPSSNANATLGFSATTYTGGANVSSTFATTVQQDVASGIEDALNSAGWITISGHHSIPTVLQSSMSPDPQNLRMLVNLYSSTNCLGVTVQNVAGTKAGTQGTSNGGFLLPSNGSYQVIANKYQAFVFVPGSNTARGYVGFGIPALPTFLQAGQASVIYEAIWLNANAASDSDTTARGSFRSSLGWNGSSVGNCTFITNGNIWEVANNPGGGGNGTFTVLNQFGNIFPATTASWYRWHDTSAFLGDPIMFWGLTSASDESMGRGILWDCFISNEAYSIDTTLTAIDGANWWNLTNNNTGSSSTGRGSVFVIY
jgi:hypothetical protein